MLERGIAMDDKWLDDLRTEFNHNVLRTDLPERIRDLRAAMTKRCISNMWLGAAIGLVTGGIIGAALALCLR